MKKILLIGIASVMGIFYAMTLNSCASTKLTAKSGDELWAENCGRCHNAPGRASYSAKEWAAIGVHMRMRAQLPANDADKMIAYLKGEK
jgi:mono/diheme cytochrome c family protein